MDNKRVRLEILGISYTPLKRDAFALLLAQVDGPYRIPIVIGASEAQSIAIKIEGIVTPRPMTHELFCSFMHAFGVELVDVFIYKFEDGIFSAELTFTDGEREVKLDSRTSDAIAIAIRTNAPIFTTEEIMLKTGTIFDEDGVASRRSEEAQIEAEPVMSTHVAGYDKMSIEELEDALQKAINDENYEEASLISEILKKRK